MRETTFARLNVANDWVIACAGIRPELTEPIAARKGIAWTPTWNSATTSRKIGGRMTAWA